MIAAQLISLRNSQRDYKFQDTQLRISVEPLLEAHLSMALLRQPKIQRLE